MPREIRETTIDGVVYRVKQFGGKTSREVEIRCGLGIGLILRGDLSLQDSTETTIWLEDKLAEATEVGITDNVGDGKTRFVALTKIYDEHFAGGPEAHAARLKWRLFALEVQFGPLGGVLKNVVGRLKALSLSSSRPTATGGTGGSSPTPG